MKIGTIVASRYQVDERLGAGGMAVVYRARDTQNGNTVALKVMSEALLDDVEAQRRFKAEYRVLSVLDHPGIPAVHEIGVTSEGLPFFAMDLVSGENLENLERLQPEDARRLLEELLPILGHIHRRGLVHGDIKGENVMLGDNKSMKLMDFGLAGPAGARPLGLEGTVTHLAPELIQRGKADQRSDLYALGVTLYKWLTGRLPIEGNSPGETLKLHLEAVPASPRRYLAEISPELESLAMRLLAKRPQDRFQSAQEVMSALGLAVDESDALAMPLQGPFVGRQTLLNELLSAVGETTQGHRPKPMTLLGAPGLGKTRLIEELGAQARLMDVQVVSGRCMGPQTPFGVWLDLGRNLLAQGRGTAPERAAALQAALAPLTGGDTQAPDAAQALRFALAQFIERLSEGRGLVIAFDDWHLIDRASHALFKQLLAQGDRWPVFWLATAVPAETLAEFTGDTSTLAPFTQDETVTLVSANLGVGPGQPPPLEVAGQIHESSRGNPRFVEDLLRYLLAQKKLAKLQQGWTLLGGSAGALPSGLQALYHARFDELSPRARALTETLALAATALPPETLSNASGLAAEEAEEALAELESRQLLTSGPGIALSDGQLASWIEHQIPVEMAAIRHGAIAQAIAKVAGDHPPLQLLNALAHHGLASPTPETALHWLTEAARANVKVKAMAEAKRFAEAARTFSSSLPPDERIEILEVLSTAHRGLDEADAALAVAKECVELAKQLNVAELIARSYNGLGKIHQLASRYDDAKDAFERAAAAAGEEVPLELARSHRAMARLVFFAGDLDGAYSHGRQALRLVRRHAEPAERAQVLAEIGETFQGEESRLQEGLACLEEALNLAREMQNPHIESMAAAGLGNLQLALGQLAGAKSSFQRAAGLFETIGNAGEAMFARLNLALVAEEQGHFVDAETRAAEVANMARALNRKFPLAAAVAVEGAALAYQGRSVEGLRRLAEAAAIAEEIKHKYVRAIIRQMEAPVRLLLGQFDEARAEANALREFGAAAGVAEMGHRATLIEANIALCAGDFETVATLVEPVLVDPHAVLRIRAHLAKGMAALALKDEPTAYQSLHAARALLPEVDSPHWEAELYLLEARLESVDGDGAITALQAGLKLMEDTHQRHLLATGLALLAQVGPEKERKAAKARARELMLSLSSALGDDAERYLAAFGRKDLLAEATPEYTQAGGIPTTLSGLRDLAQRLEQGLALAESQGVLGTGDSAMPKRRLEQIVNFANTVNSSLNLDHVMDNALALVIEISGAERGLLLLKEGSNLGTQRYLTAPGFPDDGGGEQYSRTVARTVLETGETVCVLDALSDQRFAQQASVLGLNLQTIICVPLKEKGESIGAIYVDRQGLSEQFSSSDLETMQALASLTAQAIVNAKLMRAQEERQVHLEMLNRLSRTLSRTLDLEKVLDLIADITIEVTKAERTVILLVENDELVFGAGRDQDGPLPPNASREMSRSVCQKVMETQTAVFLTDAETNEEFAAKKSIVNLRLSTVVAVPLIGQAGISGVLYVDSKTRVSKALEREVTVLTAIANTAALAVDNAKLYRQATIDSLTLLYVRSFFLLRLEEEIRRTRRFGGKFSLLVIDIDHFKKFNDTYGHSTGDAVLKQVAKTVRDGVRVGLDLPCRYGGEEFVVLLPETDTTGALVTAERIRREVETTTLSGPEGEQLQVTISIGIATFPAVAETASDLFERADQALYASKHGGRNRTTVYQVEAGTAP